MNDNDREKSGEADIISKLLYLPLNFIRTYRWVIQSSWGENDVISTPPLSWWKFLIVSSIAFIFSMTLGLITSSRVDAFSIDQAGPALATAELNHTIHEEIVGIFDQIQNHEIGQSLFVLLTTSAFWIILNIALVTMGARTFYKGDHKEFYRKKGLYFSGVLTARTAAAWIILSITAFLVATFFNPFKDPRVYWKWNSYISIACIFISCLSTFFWMILDHRNGNKYLGHRREFSETVLFFALITPIILILMGQLGSKLFPPEILISVDPQCTPTECYVYAKTENLPAIIIDSEFSATVKLSYIDNSSQKQYLQGNAKIKVSSLQPGAIPPILEPGIEQILKVQKVSLTCENKTRIHAAMWAIQMNGRPLVYVANQHALRDDHVLVDVISRGDLTSLFVNAPGGCPVGMS